MLAAALSALMAMGAVASLQGRVVLKDGGAPVPDAEVSIVGRPQQRAYPASPDPRATLAAGRSGAVTLRFAF